MRKIIYSLFLSSAFIISHAQIPVSRYFGNGELTCDLITEICQDADGFIWIGTINGLNRYDGWSFNHIYTDESSKGRLRSNYIYELFPDSHGRLWVGTNLGLQLYDRNSGSFTSVSYPDGRIVATEHIVELADGELWIVVGNIFRLNPEELTAEPVEAVNKLTSSSVVEVFVDSKGATWLSGNRGKIFVLSEENDVVTIDTEVTLRSFTESEGHIFASSGDAVYHWNARDSCFDALADDCPPYHQAKLLATHDGRILVTTAGQGFRKIDKTAMTVKPDDSFRNREVDLASITIEDWIEDKSGNIWLGSLFNGLIMISNSQPDFISMGPPQINASNDEMVNAVYFDTEGVLWSGTESGDLYMNEKGIERRHVLTLPASIYSICEQDRRRLLVGTKYYGLYVVDKTTGACRAVAGTEGLYIKRILPCPDGNIVLSLFSDGIAFYDKATGALSGNIRAGTVNTLLYDKDGYIWTGSYYGIRCYSYADRSEQTLQTNVALNSSTVYALCEGNDGIIWIGTSGGLFSYDKATETYGHYTAGGLMNNVICGIAADDDGNIWVSTFNGIVKFDPQTGKVETYKTGRGLSDASFVRGSYWQDKASGTFFFGAQHDITGFSPALISSRPLAAAPVMTELYVNERPVTASSLSGKKAISGGEFSSTNRISLASGDNDLKIFYSMLDFRETENIRIEYYLGKGRDASFTPLGSNMIVLNSLKPGRHLLRVRFEENGSLSAESTLTIHIRQPWYATWPAILAYIALATMLALAALRLYRHVTRRKAFHKANEQKLNFFTLLCYELRSPMTLITIPLQKLLRNSYDEQTGKALKSIDKNAEKVMSMLNQSLDVRKIDEDMATIQFSQVNLVSLISNLLTGAEYAAGLRNVDIDFVHSQGDIPVWINQNHFSKVILNLLGNAVKTAPKGGKISIVVKEDGKYAVTEFLDMGRELSREQMDHLFELPHRTADGSVSGLDASLYLSHAVVNRHKGSLTVSNREDGLGRRYILRIPLGNAHIPKSQLCDEPSTIRETLSQSVYYGDIAPDQDGGGRSTAGRKYSAIAIDQSEDICRYISGVLDASFKVSTFTSGAEGYNFALTNVPDLIIADLMTPDMDGISLLKRVKGNPNTAHIPVLLLTSITEEDIRLKGLLTGADAILAKPFPEEELVLVCTNLVMSRSLLASRIKGNQLTQDLLQPVELKSNNDVLLNKVITVINENISNPDLNIDLITDSIGISRGHLHRKIKEITGLSPGEYIRSIRLNQAAELLKGEKKNISQIAYSLGYSNPSVFSTAFKTFFGITAKEYQDRYAGTGTGSVDSQQPS